VLSSSVAKSTFDNLFSTEAIEFADWRNRYPDSDIFDGEPSYHDIVQGGGETCYIMAALGAVAEHPEMLKSIFLTNTDNAAGIYALRFFIRGKPWVVAIDAQMVAYKDTLKGLYFA